MQHQEAAILDAEFESARPFRVAPRLLAAALCGALGCVAVGALLGVYFAANSVSLI